MTVGRVVVGEAVGHVVEGEELLGDGLPHRAGAAGGADRQHAVAVDAVDGGAVDLQLARPPHRRCRPGRPRAHALGPGPQVVLAEHVVERLHRLEVLERREGLVERRPDLLGGRVGRAQRRGCSPRCASSSWSRASNSASGIARSDST